jgi:hypothetical protein
VTGVEVGILISAIVIFAGLGYGLAYLIQWLAARRSKRED